MTDPQHARSVPREQLTLICLQLRGVRHVKMALTQAKVPQHALSARPGIMIAMKIQPQHVSRTLRIVAWTPRRLRVRLKVTMAHSTKFVEI